jgi:hypothetical protein
MNRDWEKGSLILSGLFSGFACSTKYTGVLCPILLLCLLFYYRSFNKESGIKSIFLFGISALIPPSFWLAKNAVFFCNPVFPFFYQWLGGNVGWTKNTASSYFSMLTQYGSHSDILTNLFLAPLHISTSATQFGGGFDALGDFGWTLFIFGVPVCAFLDFKEKNSRPLKLFFLGYFLIWFWTKPVLRFLVGVLPVAVLLTSITLQYLLKKRGPLSKGVAALLIIPWLGSNIFLYFFIQKEIQPFSVALGLESREAFLKRRLAFYSAYEFINQTLTPDDKLFLLGEQRTYHLKVPYTCSNFFAPSPLAEWINSSNSLEEVWRRFKAQGYTTLLINEGEIHRRGGLLKFGFTENGVNNLESLLNQKAALLFDQKNIKIFRIL